jgi:hypothetical protein
MEAELAVLESLLESVDELAAKNFPLHFLGKEVVVPGANPAGVIGREAAGRGDTMDMRVSGELLALGMQDTEETDFRTEVSRITSDFEKSFRASAKQEIVEDSLVLQHQRRQTGRKCEDDMGIGRR